MSVTVSSSPVMMFMATVRRVFPALTLLRWWRRRRFLLLLLNMNRLLILIILRVVPGTRWVRSIIGWRLGSVMAGTI